MFVLRSPILKHDHCLPLGVSKLGRRKDCEIVINVDQVSKVHLEFHVEPHRAKVRDMDSHNGTLLNDRKMKENEWYELHAGDVIAICDFELRVSTDQADRLKQDSSFLFDSGELPRIEHSQSLSVTDLTKSKSSEHRKLLALVQLAQGLRDVLKTDQLMRRSTNLLLDVFREAARVAIALVEEDQIELKWWSERPMNKTRELAGHSTQDELPFQISRTLLTHVVDNCQAVVTSDAQADFAGARSVHSLQLGSVMAAPLIDTKGEAIGVVYMDSFERNQFTIRDFDVFAAASTQLSLALTLARLHETAIQDAIIRRDLENARSIQLKYLPSSPPAIPGFEVGSFYRAARQIGGDYFDFVSLPDGCWAILLGDVVGKGIPAALTMVRLATEARATLELTSNPAEVLSRLNQRLADGFITLLVAIVNPTAGTIRLSNAGHELPILRHADGRVELIGEECTACPVGVLESESYLERTIELAAGASLTFYSDGFPDAECAEQTRFGRQRLMETLSASQGNCEQVITSLVDKIDAFCGKHPQFDDMCLVHIRCSQ